jgi:hypothetical protein
MVEMVEYPNDEMEERFMNMLVPPTVDKQYWEMIVDQDGESASTITRTWLKLYNQEEILEEQTNSFQMRVVAHFNQPQRKVIADFLRWHADNGKGVPELIRICYSRSSGFWYHQ